MKRLYQYEFPLASRPSSAVDFNLQLSGNHISELGELMYMRWIYIAVYLKIVLQLFRASEILVLYEHCDALLDNITFCLLLYRN